MEEYNTSEIWEKIKSYPYNFIKLDTRNGQNIVPYPSRTVKCEERERQIKTFLESDQTADGIYILTIRSGTAKSGEHKFLIRVGDTPKIESLKDDNYFQKVKTELISDSDLLELKVQLATLISENAYKDAEIERLNSIIDELENELNENKTLSDEAPNNLTWLKEILPGLADTFFSQRAAQQEIERAKLGLELQKLQTPKIPEIKKTTIPTLDELNEFKKHNPSDFYNWYADPKNAELYNTLSNEQF